MSEKSSYTGDQTPGYHGNQSYGVSGALARLQKGKPFVGLALDLYHRELARRGFSEAQLSTMGVQGAIIEKCSKLHAICDLLWAAMLWCAELGDVDGFHVLEQRYGGRLAQSLTQDYRMLEMLEKEREIVNYDAAVASAKAAGGDDTR